MQKSTRNGSQEISAVAVADGTGIEGSAVLAGMTFVLTTTGIGVTWTFVQDTRNNSKRRNFGVRQLAGVVLDVKRMFKWYTRIHGWHFQSLSA